MAAYAALVSLFNDLELIPNHPTHSFSFDNKQLSSLSQTVNSLIDFMETYDSHGCTTEAAEALESRIASAAHAAHDVIESHLGDQIHAGSTLVGGRTGSYFLPDLQRAIEGVEFVRTETMQFQAKSGLKAEQPKYSSAPSTSSTEPLVTENKKNAMVGFDSVLLRLLDILTGEPSNQRSVVPIVGMGGIGKTTLAQNAYDHSYIQEHFDLLLWATISQDYSVESILTQLLSGERKSITSGNASELGEDLRKKKLWGRRYLVVLDDMWSERAWDRIKMYLPDNGNGSRVIITTRLSNLATTHLSSSSPFEMDFLAEDKSWELFCEKAFGGAEEDCPVELEVIGKKIVKRCRGLPLSIVVIGGHLRQSSRTIEYWEKLSTSVNPISSIGRDDQCLEILRLSYQHLPACLKPCFLYTGVFKEDHRIHVSQLVRYWVGEGFIKPKRGLILEEVAEDYLEDLIDRNLVLVRQRRWNGKAEHCAIHDVVRELCVKVAKKEKFIGVVETVEATRAKGCEERRIVVPAELSTMRQHRAGGLGLPLLLRSVICHRNWLLDELSVDFRLLRLSTNIDLDMTLWRKNIYCPTSNFQQVNLRYPVFRVHSPLIPYCIPSSISLLWNLQTLIVVGRSDFGSEIIAPCEIWELPQLRHLQFNRFHLPCPLPSEDGSNQEEECIILRNLHTLIGVMDLKLTEEVCKRIPNIKKLRLLYYTLPAGDQGKEARSSYYCLHNLGRLNKLESLECDFGRDPEWRDVIQSLKFPSSLVELSIWCCYWEDLTKMIKSSPQLGYLYLGFVRGSEWDLAEDEEFPHLRILKIISSPGLIHWNASSSNFPVLEELHIYFSELSEIPFDLGEIPTLRLIHLSNCSAPCALSAVRIAVEQEDVGNEDLQLRVRFDKMKGVERFQKMMGEEGLISNNLSLYHWGDKIMA